MAKAREDHITSDTDALANKLEKKMKSTNLNMSPERCIFKVPNILFRQNPKAYLPNAFSIGPYHYGKKHLKATRKIKYEYLHELINRLQGMTSVRTLIEDIGKVQQEARDCYAEPFDNISTDKFVEILVLDGCFLIELFRKNVDVNLRKDGDPIFTMGCMQQILRHDLTLLENQIPWWVLERLFLITRNPEYPEIAVLSILALSYCYPFGLSNRSESYIKALAEPFLNGEIKSKHILDLLRNSLMVKNSKITEEMSSKCQCMHLTSRLKEAANNIKNMGSKYLCPNRNCLEQCLPTYVMTCLQLQDQESNEWKHMPSATRLKEAGVNLKAGKSSTPILHINFKDGDLEIPRLRIEDTTESLFRNLICLEQCLPKCRPIVTCYAKLLDDLINTNKDMEILCESEILDNWLNNDDAAKLFNRLGNDTCVTGYHYSGVIKDVNKFCQRCWPRNRAALKHNYFNNAWVSISVIAAAILLILTVAQTVFTIIK